MTASTMLDPVVAYAAAVRSHLVDLGPEVLDDLTGGLEADLAESVADALDGAAPTDAVERFRETLIVNPQVGSRLVQVGFDADDPRLAAGIVNSVLDNYIKLRMEDAQRSARWLQAQLQDARKKLDDSQRQLQAYADALVRIYPGRRVRAALLWTDGARLMEVPLAA